MRACVWRVCVRACVWCRCVQRMCACVVQMRVCAVQRCVRTARAVQMRACARGVHGADACPCAVQMRVRSHACAIARACAGERAIVRACISAGARVIVWRVCLCGRKTQASVRRVQVQGSGRKTRTREEVQCSAVQRSVVLGVRTCVRVRFRVQCFRVQCFRVRCFLTSPSLTEAFDRSI